mgnify:CR=1 FL=1
MCTIDIPLPESERDWSLFAQVQACYAVQQVRKAEVKWSTLDADGRAKFEKAKHAEIDQWLEEEAVKAVEGHIPRERVMRMRWVLTYKDTGAAKARLVLIGFEDPDLDRLVSSSPTMCRRTRQLVLQAAIQQGWKPLKGDIKSAFLQGTASQTLRQVYALPVPELAHALGVPEGRAVQVQKACYGLVNAPAEFYRTVDSHLLACGFERLLTDPCAWRLRRHMWMIFLFAATSRPWSGWTR